MVIRREGLRPTPVLERMACKEKAIAITQTKTTMEGIKVQREENKRMRMTSQRMKGHSTVTPDERVQEAAEDAVQLDEEALLTDNFVQALRLHHVARHTGKAIWIDLLGRQERGYWGDVACR